MLNGCCFTGHRNIPKEDLEPLRGRLWTCLDWLHNDRKITTFFTGGCTGFDTIAAKTVLEYRAVHSDVRLIVVVPHREQAKSWSVEDKIEYERINQAASEIVCLAEHYFRGCMHQRNRYMVNHSSVCICYLTKDKGGTASTVKYAQGKGLIIRNLANTDENRNCPI